MPSRDERVMWLRIALAILRMISGQANEQTEKQLNEEIEDEMRKLNA